MNKDKTSIFFSSNTSQKAWNYFLQLSRVLATQRYDKYLGLLALVGKSRVREFKSIEDRVWNRLNGRKIKFLSQAGKEILLKAIIQAIQTYGMSVFLLPQALFKEINSVIQKFWWVHKKKKILKSIGWVGKS
jgi:hypothetical protein